MRALTISVSALALLFVVLPIAHAKTNYAYVANYSENTVSVIDTSNNTVVKTIPVGKAPWGVAVNQAGSAAYVTNHNSASVSVISTSDNKVTKTIPVGADPVGVAFTPDGKSAYVANKGSVSVINTESLKVIATVATPGGPGEVAVNPTGAYVYVTNANAASVVSVISTLTNKVVAAVTVGAYPFGVALSPDGATAYVANYNSNTISVIRTADNAVVNTINVSAGPQGATVSPDGHWLYVAHSPSGSNLVTVIDTQSQTVVAGIVVGSQPNHVAFTQDSAFAYVSSGDGTVSVIDTASRTVTKSISVGTQLAEVGVMGTMTVSTVAGGYVGDRGLATDAALGPYFIVRDQAGNDYVSDRFHNRIRKIAPDGKITTIAGTGICGYNGDNIPASKAMLCNPVGLAFDPAGNLYVADGANARVRKIGTNGKITTAIGTGVAGYSGDGGPATNAAINFPWAMAFDNTGNLFFSDTGNNIVRKVNTSGIISTYAGTGAAGFSGDGGPATSATMNSPRGIALDGSGNLYIADLLNRRVRIVSADGTINTFAGTGAGGCAGDGGPALAANLGNVRGVNLNNGVLYISAAGCQRVRAVDLSTNLISTFAGSYAGYDGDNNPPLSSRFNTLSSVIFDTTGNALITDSVNGRVRKLSGGLITTFAGGYLGDGQKATSAAFVFPEAMAIDKANNLYIADYHGHRIRKVSKKKMSTVAGTGVNGYDGDGGPALNALLNYPQGVAADSNGNVFIADEGNGVVRKVDTLGKISTFAADPNFCDLAQMSMDSTNNLYVADDCTSVIFKITPAGIVTVVAGVPFTYGYNGDGILATDAELNTPISVAVDNSGNIFIADTYNSRLRMVDTSGIIHTIAGDGNCNYSGDGGLATAAELCLPWSVAASGSGTVYFVDYNYGRVRKISDGVISAFVSPGVGLGFGVGAPLGFNGDGLWPLFTTLDEPVAVAVDSNGAVYVLDDFEHRVRKIQ
jgi:YVTN family beta-propeller protein